jgi:hypothetical protein
VNAAAILAAVLSGLVVLAVVGSYVWAAREDGRDQRRRDAARGPGGRGSR